MTEFYIYGRPLELPYETTFNVKMNYILIGFTPRGDIEQKKIRKKRFLEVVVEVTAHLEELDILLYREDFGPNYKGELLSKFCLEKMLIDIDSIPNFMECTNKKENTNS